ncbi:hypothetical protein BDY19DRAFT_558355 [Irpex rosettiformis]|uniref:Uncharacterized protein n=1 Tax=Irpex rosettiformis TaxID=378272 RepID=A0ACB8TQ58_9APHY|nr:hypothetical protein BDY19DRAFT_558355 [Irpex rosettiformis]
MAHSHKPQIVPPSSSSELSEPSTISPEDESKEQLTGTREENPQVIMHEPGKQAADIKNAGNGDKVAKEGFSGGGYTGTYRSKSKL